MLTAPSGERVFFFVVVLTFEYFGLQYLKRTPMEAVMGGKFTFDQGDGNLPNSVVLGSDYIAKMYQPCAIEVLIPYH